MTPLPALAATAALLTRFESGDLRGLVLAETGAPKHPEQFADEPSVFARLTVVDGRPCITAQVVWFGFAGQIESPPQSPSRPSWPAPAAWPPPAA